MTAKVLKLYINASKWLPSKHQWIQLTASISKSDCDYVHNFKYQNDCKIRLLSQLLIRYSIKTLTDLNWNEICIERTPYGKPFCKNIQKSSFDFNVSHSGDYVAIVAMHTPNEMNKYQIGVDLMKIESNLVKQYEQVKRISRKTFSEKEIDFLESKSSLREKVEDFYRIWTLKESYVKAIGKGIRVELKAIEFLIHSDYGYNPVISDTELFIDSKKIVDCKIYEQMIDNCYIASICLIDHKNDDVILKSQTFNEILIDEIIKHASKYQLDNSNDDLFLNYWSLYLNKE